MHPLYVDVSDEVTTVIERLKAAPDTEVSLVVPKGAVLLQSIVNLKLIRKAAREAGKELTLITTDRIGRNLAAQVGIANLSHLDSSGATGSTAETESDVVGGITIHRYYDEEESAATAVEPQAVEPIVPIPPVTEPLIEDEAGPISVRSFATLADPSGIEIIKPTVPTIPTIAVTADLDASTTPRRHLTIPFIALLLLLLIGAGTVGAYYYPKTIITVSVPGKAWTKTYLSQAGVSKPLDSTHLIVASFISTTQNESLTVQATGTKDIGTPAHGTATLSYIQDSSPQEVPAGTVLSANGIAFTTDAPVTVPGAKVVNATPTAGTDTVAVTSSVAGIGGNMSGVPATVSGYKLYAQIQSSTGGTSQQVPVITQTDIANGKQQLQDKLQAEATGVLAKDPANHPPVMDTSKTDSFSFSSFVATTPAGSQTASDILTATGTLKRLVYDPTQLDVAVKQQAINDAAGLANLKIESQVQNVDLTNGVISLSSTASGIIVPEVDTNLIRTQTVGKSVDNATSLIKGIVSGASVSFVQSPAWWPLKRVPYSDKYVSVHIQP